MILRFLGTKGEAEEQNDKHKENSSLLIEYKGKKLLIDWGVSHKDEKLPDVDIVLLTHCHPNHSGAADKLVHKKTIMNKTTAAKLRKIPFEDVEVINDNEIKDFVFGPFKITAFPAMHSIIYPMTCYKVKGDSTIAYCPDVLWIRKRTKLLKGVDIYIGDGSSVSRSVVREARKEQHEVFGHASILAQLKWCKIEDIPRAIFTHFGEEVIKEGGEKTIELLEPKFKNGVVFKFAYDGLNINTTTFKELEGAQMIVFYTVCTVCGYTFDSEKDPEENDVRCPKCGGKCTMGTRLGEKISKKLSHDTSWLHRGDHYVLTEKFKKEGIDSDMVHKKKSWRDLLADLRYIGNKGYPRLKVGQKWGDWKLDILLRYYAKIVDVLRSINFTLIPPKRGEKGYITSYWRCYREAEKYMKSKSPALDEVKEWNKKRRELIIVEED